MTALGMIRIAPVGPVVAMAGLLAACGPAQAPVEAAEGDKGADVVARDAAVPGPVPATAMGPLSAADLRRVCLAGMAAVHGQSIDAAGTEGQTVKAIRIDGVEGGVVALSWPAPVDGGRRSGDCRVEGDRILWRPTGLPDGQTSDWMTGEADPVIRYAMDGDRVVVTQTYDDATVAQTELTVPRRAAS